MKKLFSVVILAAVITGVGAWAQASGPIAVGLYGSFGYEGTGGVGGLGVSLKFGRIPVGIKYNFGSDAAIGASVDFHIVDEQTLVDSLKWYLGLGAFLGIHFTGSNNLDFGARIPIGLQFYPIRNLEIFLGAIPIVKFLPTIGLGFGGELGVRIHF